MSETYVECLVSKKPSVLMRFASVLCIMLAVVFFILAFAGNLLAWVVTIAAGVGAFLLHERCDVEYEYLYVDKEISVDRIFAKSRRKKAGVYSLDRMEIMAPIRSYHLDGYKNRTTKDIDYSIGTEEQPDLRYALYYEGNVKLIMSPSPEFVKALQNVAPRKVFTD